MAFPALLDFRPLINPPEDARVMAPDDTATNEVATITTPVLTKPEAPNLFNIPLEIRYEILSYFLSNHSITSANNGSRNKRPKIPSMLLVNRQF